MILNLAYPDKSELKYELIVFPDKHQHLRILDANVIHNRGIILIKIRIRDFNDIFILKQAVEVLRSVRPDIKINLEIAYLLAARYDRKMIDCDSFDLKIVTDEIQSLKFDHIFIVEPHSNVSTTLLPDAKVLTPIDDLVEVQLREYLPTNAESYECCFVVPDLGAVKRVEKIAGKLHNDINIVFSNKHRNLKTGEILGIDVFNAEKLKPVVFILDDLCDGGRTFTELAKKLRALGAKKIILAVTHSIFSKGTDVLLKPNDDGSYVDLILTTNSYQHLESDPDNKIIVTTCI